VDERVRARKKEQTRVAIEDAALELFAERGYEETTVDEIAARSGVSRATFFRYFATKGDVVFGGPDDRHLALQLAIVDRPTSEDPLTAVRAAMRDHWLRTVDPQRTARQTRAARSSPVLRGLSLDLGVRWQSDVADALARRAGVGDPDRSCHLVAGVAFTVMSNAVNLWMDDKCAGDLVQAVDEGFDLLQQLSNERTRRSPRRHTR
jgi:AcrR family transcriptional regulator